MTYCHEYPLYFSLYSVIEPEAKEHINSYHQPLMWITEPFMTLSRVSSIVHTYLNDSDCLLEGSIEALVTLNLVFTGGGSVLCVVSSVLKYRIDLETAETSVDKLPEIIRSMGHIHVHVVWVWV